jgi:transcriptional regulator with XRE-family HTH domain
MTQTQVEVPPSRRLAAEIRAELARRGLSNRRFAMMLGVNYMWVNRRIGMSANQDLTLEDLDRIAAALGVPTGQLVAAAKWAPWGSNPQPAD